ncbi:hypothetical protein HMPREF1624_05766 [Sporothrix schenckii ATCC 58251]|uniref:Extracellular membrane protein CFEM domain-containing protein n=1 Tax=Sporothrix schenckii (strain ATCC 58251 / de Perez 2211183) TaxID=1391915 RepID=U7PT09_SPOS1|nr:hypothetical protein HMPREF1624_05766 [Sporothrix schenckii ATCC 58251]
MLSSLYTVAVCLSLSATPMAQTVPACPADLAASTDCADVINPNACYNEFGFRGQQTLNCIEGKDKADKARKVGALSTIIISPQ